MRKFILFSSFCIFINLLPSVVFSAVVINEIMFNPLTPTDYSGEWLEIYNLGEEYVNISGWSLTDNLQTDTIECFNSTVNCSLIPPSAFAIITTTDTVIYQNWTISDNVTKLTVDDTRIGNGLGNSGDIIILKNNSDAIIDVVNYSDSIPISEGYTLERIDPTGTNESINWKPSNNVDGTPGSRNSVTPTEHDLSIYSENITFDPTDPSPRTGVNISTIIQNNGLYNETNINISFYNISNSISSLIHSQLVNITKQSHANLTIKWNNTQTGDFTILVQIENFTDDNMTNNNATKNITFDFHLVINEVMYNPPSEIGSDADYEWLEIHNNATYDENLTGWSLECDNKRKELSGTLNSNDYLVFAKDTTEFYNYYSSSIETIKQSCSLNNDGDTIKLVFNDSIYYEEELTYSNSWGADGTGYSLEKINPTSNNNADNWAESVVYGGTPGAKNNPDTKIKSSLATTSTTVLYRSVTETIYANEPQEENPDYKIVSFQEVVYLNEPFKTIVSLKSDTKKTVTLYSYVYDGNKILSEGFDGKNWKGSWTANEKKVTINQQPILVELENKIKFNTEPGKYHFRVRIKDEVDLTKVIEVLPQIKLQPTTESNKTESNKTDRVSITCEQLDDNVEITIISPTEKSILLLHYSRDNIRNKTLNVNDTLTYTLSLEDGHNSIIFLENDNILNLCSFSFEESLPITGRTIEVISFSNLMKTVKSWLEKLNFLNIFRNT